MTVDQADGYQRAIDELLKVPSHETHVAADWLEAQRDGHDATFAHTNCAAEVERWEAACASAMAEVEALKADLAKAVRERDSLARRCADRFQETEKLRVELDILGQQLSDSRALCVGHVDERDLATAKENLSILEDARNRRDQRIADLVEERELALRRIENQAEQNRLGGEQIHRLQRELAEARDERDRYRQYSIALNCAVRHVLALYDSGNVLGTIAAIPGLREVLDGGT